LDTVLNQHYSPHAYPAQTFILSDTNKICVFCAPLAQRVRASIAHIMRSLLTGATYMPTWMAQKTNG